MGAVAFWHAVEAMGDPRRTPKESVDALEVALMILRTLVGRAIGLVRRPALPGHGGAPWSATRPPGPNLASRIRAANAAAHGPRMLRLTGRLADGWLAGLGGHYLSPEDAPKGHAAVDEAARRAGRDAKQIERVLNIMVPLDDQPSHWRDQLADRQRAALRNTAGQRPARRSSRIRAATWGRGRTADA